MHAEVIKLSALAHRTLNGEATAESDLFVLWAKC